MCPSWRDDSDTLRKAGAATDPYTVFGGMPDRGNPSDDWLSLLAASRPLELQ
jgi:toxin YhaV